MVYSLHGVGYEGFLHQYSTLPARGDTVIVAANDAADVDLRAEYDGTTHVLGDWMRLSAEMEIDVLLPMRARVDGRVYESVAVLSRGSVLGVSDAVRPTADVRAGRELRAYRLPRGIVGISVGQDIRYPQLWEPFAGQVSRLYLLSRAYCNGADVACARAAAIGCGCQTIADFDDASVCIRSDGVVEQVECGKLRPFFKRPHIDAPYRIAQVPFTLEGARD